MKSIDKKDITHWFKSHNILTAFMIVIAVCMLPIIPYIINFRRLTISDNPSDWGIFGDYVGGIDSIIVALIVVYIGNLITRNEDKNKTARTAIIDIYKQINDIDSRNINLSKVIKLTKSIADASLFIPQEIYAKLIQLTDNYKLTYSFKDKFDPIWRMV